MRANYFDNQRRAPKFLLYFLQPNLIMNQEPQSPAPSRLDDPQFRELVRRKSSLSLTLTALVFLVYFGFIFLMAFAPDVLAVRVGATTLGIPVGIGIIVFAWILTGVYVRWANGAYDSMIARVRKSK